MWLRWQELGLEPDGAEPLPKVDHSHPGGLSAGDRPSDLHFEVITLALGGEWAAEGMGRRRQTVKRLLLESRGSWGGLGGGGGGGGLWTGCKGVLEEEMPRPVLDRPRG